MIFNIPLGGSSYITVTAPSTSSVSATCSGMTVSGVGSCTLEVPIIGEWTVSCTYDNTTLTDTVNVTTFGETYTKIFTFTATISITCPVGASIIASLTGQNDVTRTGPGDITVIKTGVWSVKCTYDGTELANTVIVASYGESYSTSFTYNATITISCPSGASIVASMSGQTDVTRTGPGDITVPKKGTWSVSCTYDGSTQTNNVTVAYGGSESVSFTYSCTIVVNTQINSFVTISMSGQTSQTATASNGTVTFTVPKSGSWSVTTEYARGTNGATSKTGSVTAVYGASRSISIYPRIYIYKLNTGNGYYVSPYGLHLLDADNAGSELSLNSPYGAWKDLKHKSWDSGNNVVVTVNGIKLDGYTKMHAHARYLDAWSISWGFHKPGNNVYSIDQWTPKVTIKSPGTRSSSSFQDWEFTFSLSGYYHPVFRNLNGSSDLSADFEVHEWYIE